MPLINIVIALVVSVGIWVLQVNGLWGPLSEFRVPR
jgi:hypothetical protein